MHVWNVLHEARWKYRTQKWRKNRPLCTIAQLCRAISSQLRHVSTIGKKKLVKQQYLFDLLRLIGVKESTSANTGMPHYSQRKTVWGCMYDRRWKKHKRQGVRGHNCTNEHGITRRRHHHRHRDTLIFLSSVSNVICRLVKIFHTADGIIHYK